MSLVVFPLHEPDETDRQSVKIVHLSDFHYDGKNEDLMATVMAHVVEEGPRFIVVTGDIVEGPTDDFSVPAMMLKNAVADIERFFGHRPVLRVAPGNHDFFYKGTYGMRRTKKFLEAFSDEERGNYYRPGDPVTIATFDSNQLFEPLGGIWRKAVQLARFMSHGLIIERDLDAFSDWIRGLKQSETAEGYARSFKIALLHHHPMPTKFSFLPRLADESYMMLENAGVFMYRLIQEKFDLILHGHRHLPQFCRAAYYDHMGVETQIAVLGCGSSAKRSDEWTRIAGHNFNVITLHPDGCVRATQYYKRGTKDFLPAARDIFIHAPQADPAKNSVGINLPTGTTGC